MLGREMQTFRWGLSFSEAQALPPGDTMTPTEMICRCSGGRRGERAVPVLSPHQFLPSSIHPPHFCQIYLSRYQILLYDILS